MADDLRDALHFWGSFLQQKHQNFGGLRAKTTMVENLFMGVNAFLEVDQRNRGEVYHQDHAMFEPMLAEDMDSVSNRIMQICQMLTDDQFIDLTMRLIDYSAVLSDSLQRKKAMGLYGLFMAHRTRHNAGGYVQQQRAPEPAPPPQVVVKYIEKPAPPPEVITKYIEAPKPPPHEHEQLFKPYMDLGPKAGSDRIGVEFERMNRTAAAEFLRAFVDYAVTLRTTEQLKTAFALSNKMYVIFIGKRADNVIALAAPTRRS